MTPPTTRQAATQEWLPRLLMWGLLGGILLSVTGLGIWSLIRPQLTVPSPPVYGVVPGFTLIDQNRRPLGKDDLRGKIWIANFIYTNCPDECPLMTAEMARIQSGLAGIGELRLVSITVDPEHDTPAVLSRYAERVQADPERWFFLTGDKSAIYRLAREGFKLAIVDPLEAPPALSTNVRPLNPPRGPSTLCTPQPLRGAMEWSPVLLSRWPDLLPANAFADHGRTQDPLHSSRFILIDQLGQIRGYYDSRDEAALQRLCQHVQILRQGT